MLRWEVLHMKDSIKRIAEQFIDTHFPEADIVWIGGSSVYNNLTTESDIDLIIIDETETSRLECHYFLDWKIEAFIFTRFNLDIEFQRAKFTGVPTIIKMCADGLCIKDQQMDGEELQREAKELYEQGPEIWDEAKINAARYQLTDFLSDFKNSEEYGESLFILNNLINTLTKLVLRANGKWIGEGKWIARELKSYDKDLYDRLIKCTQTYMNRDDKTELISFIQSILNRYGGELFAGFKEYFFK